MRLVLKAIALLWLVNFIAFVVAAFALGGDALNGYQAGGHYFLAMHKGSHATEVSRRIFEYSRWHAYLVIATLPVAMLAGWFAKRKRDKGDT